MSGWVVAIGAIGAIVGAILGFVLVAKTPPNTDMPKRPKTPLHPDLPKPDKTAGEHRNDDSAGFANAVNSGGDSGDPGVVADDLEWLYGDLRD